MYGQLTLPFVFDTMEATIERINMTAQLYVCEQPDNTFIVYDKEDNRIVYTATNLHNAVDFCYSAGANFEVEILEQMLLDFERADA